MLISVLAAIVVAAAAESDVILPARRARNETYCGRAGRGSFRCRGRGRTKMCWADETCKSNATHARATPGEQLWMTRVMAYGPAPPRRGAVAPALYVVSVMSTSRLGGSGDSS
jgi:hypothetical protein